MTPSPLRALVLALSLVGLTASPAAAADELTDSAWTPAHVLLGGVVAAGGAALGLVGGFAIARQQRSYVGVILPLVAGNLVTGLALEGLGAATGHNGSGLAASAASLGVQVLGATLFFTGNGDETNVFATVVAQGLVASMVYALTGEDEPSSGAQSGALLRYNPAHGLSVGTPAGAVTPDAEGGYTVGLTLAAGTF